MDLKQATFALLDLYLLISSPEMAQSRRRSVALRGGIMSAQNDSKEKYEDMVGYYTRKTNSDLERWWYGEAQCAESEDPRITET